LNLRISEPAVCQTGLPFAFPAYEHSCKKCIVLIGQWW